MRSIAAVLTMLLLPTGTAEAGQLHRAGRCLVEVLYSEELPIGPLFHHTVRANLLVTAPDAAPVQTTVYKVIPWQVPPPRRGQRVWVWCDPAALNSSFGLF